MNIYVGNLAYQTSEEELRTAFEQFGAVDSVHIIKDRDTGQSKGFGFVEMGSAADGQAAIEALNGKDFNGRKLNVNEARARAEGGRGGGRGGGESRGGGGRGFGGGSGENRGGRGFGGGSGEGRGGGRRY